ncbi:LPXTG cell wall anchor domain-containing protein [uncultured Rothia sp.]|uniref:LPXTG cell wall anchor domain-containing protein n=1 Tax=uncultured Rothia sp. TaxID=316088 RepID=UPI0025D8CD46|nr:LPXTG cell wall anchor domain-containing protein [uncultured Rothia sp.]
MSKTTRRVYKIAAAAAFTAGSVVAIPATFAAEAPADQNGPAVAVAQHPNGEVNVEAATQNPAATETPKTEAPKAEAPKTEAPKAETPAPKAEAPKTEAPKAETPAPKTEAPKAEAPKAEAPKTEAPKTEAPKAETPKAEAPKTEAPKTEETPKADPKTEQADPTIEIEEADFPADAAINTITVRASGFQGAKVGVSVNVSIYALDANQQVTGDPIATITVDANQIKDGAFNASFNVPAAQLPAGASYALVAVSNPQGQPAEKLVALSSFKVTETTTPRSQTPKVDETPAPETPKVDETPAPETPKVDETPAPETPKADETPAPETPTPETPKAETPKADETPAPETPAVPEPQNATLTTESASLDPNDEYNVVTVNGAGFTHESASRGVQVAIYRLDADGNITGEALAVQDVPASEIMEGTFTAKLSVRADRLLPGYVYALVATSDPNGLVHQVAVTTASVSDVDHPAPTVPAASNDDNTTVRDNGDGTTSVFTAKMSEDGSVTVTETRVPSSQAPRAKVGNTPVTASSQEGHTVSARDVAGRSTSDSSSRPQLAHTGAEGVAGIAGVGAAALIAGAALMLLRRRSL